MDRLKSVLLPDESSVCLPCWKMGGSEPRGFQSGSGGFDPWSSQTNNCKIDTWRFLVWRLALVWIGQGLVSG